MSWISRKKKENIFCSVYFFNICVLSQCKVYWIHFQNIHTFTYQKHYFINFCCLFWKSLKAYSVSLSSSIYPYMTGKKSDTSVWDFLRYGRFSSLKQSYLHQHNYWHYRYIEIIVLQGFLCSQQEISFNRDSFPRDRVQLANTIVKEKLYSSNHWFLVLHMLDKTSSKSSFNKSSVSFNCTGIVHEILQENITQPCKSWMTGCCKWNQKRS